MTSSQHRTSLIVSSILLLQSVTACNAQEPESDRFFRGHMQKSSNETLQIDACATTLVEISASANGFKISSPATESLVDVEEEVEDTEIVAGDFWNNGRCFVAIKSSASLVNESFDIHRVDSENTGPQWSTINPEFIGGRVISSYRDAARWHEEALCYSESIDSPYICWKRETATNELQRLTECNDKGECDDRSMVLTGTDEAANAIVSADRAFFLQNSGESLERRRSYLISGDSVTLLDFLEVTGSLYFKVRYCGDTGTRVGWLSSDDLTITASD